MKRRTGGCGSWRDSISIRSAARWHAISVCVAVCMADPLTITPAYRDTRLAGIHGTMSLSCREHKIYYICHLLPVTQLFTEAVAATLLCESTIYQSITVRYMRSLRGIGAKRFRCRCASSLPHNFLVRAKCSVLCSSDAYDLRDSKCSWGNFTQYRR